MRRAGPIAAVILSAALAGCGSTALFGKYPEVESPEVADAPWPRLVDTPEAPPPGRYTPAVPDPARGYAAEIALGAAARAAGARAAAIAPPILSEEERRRLRRAR